MTAANTAYTLRLATAAELPLAVAIDDAAALLFQQAGLRFDFTEQHPFVLAEVARWRCAIAAGLLWFACRDAQAVGFCALGRAGGLAYLEQLSVHPDHGRRGVGARLLAHAFAYSHEHAELELWLTTYAHIPWNRLYYERHGFEVVPEQHCNTALRALLAEQRAYLPDPDQRVAMRCKLSR